MSDIKTDILSVENVIKALYPTYDVRRQKVPITPSVNQFVIRFQNEDSETETGFHYRIDREYQLIYFSDDIVDVLDTMDTLRRDVNNRQIIPFNDGSLRYLFVTGFSFSQPFETENDLDAVIAVLQGETREARDQETFTKIANVYARTETKG